jgi:hypothetical protein
MQDFTLKSYNLLLTALIDQGYSFQTFGDFLRKPANKVIVLRHDVDARKENSLQFAKIQHKLGIVGSYYFRVAPQSYDEKIIKEIAAMGHEVGYHYETMETVNAKCRMQNVTCKTEELVDLAYEEFCRNLEMFRGIVPVTTICMHGSPRSKFDNKDIWKKYDYRKLGIIGEPYFDIDFNKVAYLTDTGRMWNGDKVSIRDKVKSPFNFNFRTTNDIILGIDQLPDKVMFTFHPQRWTDNPVLWTKEVVWQNLKNQVKRIAVSGQQSAISDQRSAVSGQRSAVSSQRSAVSDQK